jgi:hypothetical protein
MRKALVAFLALALSWAPGIAPALAQTQQQIETWGGHYTAVWFGAKGNGKIVPPVGGVGASMTSGQNEVTDPLANFTQADVGKAISVVGAGTQVSSIIATIGNKQPLPMALNTTIATVIDATHATTAANAGNTVSGVEILYGSDDTLPIWNCIKAGTNTGGRCTLNPNMIFMLSPANSAVAMPINGSKGLLDGYGATVIVAPQTVIGGISDRWLYPRSAFGVPQYQVTSALTAGAMTIPVNSADVTSSGLVVGNWIVITSFSPAPSVVQYRLEWARVTNIAVSGAAATLTVANPIRENFPLDFAWGGSFGGGLGWDVIGGTETGQGIAGLPQTVTSAAYNSTTGVVTLTFASTPTVAQVGGAIGVSGFTGASAAQVNGSFPVSAVSGNTVSYVISTGLSPAFGGTGSVVGGISGLSSGMTIAGVKIIIPAAAQTGSPYIGVTAIESAASIDLTVKDVECIDAAYNCYAGEYDRGLTLKNVHFNETVASEFAGMNDINIDGVWDDRPNELTQFVSVCNSGQSPTGPNFDGGTAYGHVYVSIPHACLYPITLYNAPHDLDITAHVGFIDNVVPNTSGIGGLVLSGAYRVTVHDSTFAGGTTGTAATYGIYAGDFTLDGVTFYSDANVFRDNHINDTGPNFTNEYSLRGAKQTDCVVYLGQETGAQNYSCPQNLQGGATLGSTAAPLQTLAGPIGSSGVGFNVGTPTYPLDIIDFVGMLYGSGDPAMGYNATYAVLDVAAPSCDCWEQPYGAAPSSVTVQGLTGQLLYSAPAGGAEQMGSLSGNTAALSGSPSFGTPQAGDVITCAGCLPATILSGSSPTFTFDGPAQTVASEQINFQQPSGATGTATVSGFLAALTVIGGWVQEGDSIFETGLPAPTVIGPQASGTTNRTGSYYLSFTGTLDGSATASSITSSVLTVGTLTGAVRTGDVITGGAMAPFCYVGTNISGSGSGSTWNDTGPGCANQSSTTLTFTSGVTIGAAKPATVGVGFNKFFGSCTGAVCTAAAVKTVNPSGNSEATTLPFSAPQVTDTGLTSAAFVGTDSNGKLIAASGGSTTTTGSPVAGEITEFSGAETLTNGNLSGDCTTTNTLVTTCQSVFPIEDITGASHTFGASEIGDEARRSNSGSAMTDTFPASSASGLFNGSQIIVNNTDASASLTITAGAGTTINTGSTDVVPAGRSMSYIYDLANTVWRHTRNSGNTVLGPSSQTGGDVPTFNGTVTTGPVIQDSGVALSSLAPLASPALTGAPTAPTQSAGDSSTKIATDAFVAASFAPLVSPALTTPNLGVANATDVEFGSAGLEQWASTSSQTGTVDTTLSRNAAGVLQIGSGASAGAGGSLDLANLAFTGTVSNAASISSAVLAFSTDINSTATSGTTASFDSEINISTANTGTVVDYTGYSQYSGAGTLAAMYDFYGLSGNLGVGTVTVLAGAFLEPENVGGGTVTTMYGVYDRLYMANSSTTTTGYANYDQLVLPSGSSMNTYTVFADLPDSGSGSATTERGFWQTAANHPNEFSSSVTALNYAFLTTTGSASGNEFYLRAANDISASINGSTIGDFTSTGLNGMAIGATTAAAGTFTALTATSLSLSSGDPISWNSDTSVCREGVGIVEIGASGTCGATGEIYNVSFAANFDVAGARLIGATAPSSCAEAGSGSPTCTIGTNLGSATVKITLASSSSATSLTLTIPSADEGTNLPICDGFDYTTTTIRLKQTGGTQTTAVMTYYNDAGTATSPGASDVIYLKCLQNFLPLLLPIWRRRRKPDKAANDNQALEMAA